VQYPNNIKKEYTKLSVSHKNRGMNLENSLNISNEYYREKDRALIYKKPTPIGVVDVSYKNNRKTIEKAYFKEQSTLDYNGLYRGKYIEFDAKETLNKTAFPLSNVHEHQTLQIRNVIKHGGIVFLIIRMNDITYLLTGEDYISYIDTEDRKSISYKYIEEKAHVIKESYQPPLDYLNVVDKIYFKGE
jgi:recombination protein U